MYWLGYLLGFLLWFALMVKLLSYIIEKIGNINIPGGKGGEK